MNLRLLQLCDSALPIGGYMHSWGLEAALARGLVRDAASLEEWTQAWLRYSLGPLEGIVTAAVCRAVAAGEWTTAYRANELLDAAMLPPSLRRASQDMGEHLLVLAATWPWSAPSYSPLPRFGGEGNTSAWHHAVVFGVLGALAEGSPCDTVQAYLHQAALGMIGAGVRGIPVSHIHGQQILAYLHPEIERFASELAERPLETAGSGCPFYEVLCDEQTRLYTRVFRS